MLPQISTPLLVLTTLLSLSHSTPLPHLDPHPHQFRPRPRSLAALEFLDIPSDPATVHTIPLRRSPHTHQRSSRALHRRAPFLTTSKNITAPPANSQIRALPPSTFLAGSSLLRATGASFLIPISFGSQSFLSILDTGSADTWLAHRDFTCVDLVTNATRPGEKCRFGATYVPSTNDTSGGGGSGGGGGGEWSQIADQNFNITYGDGEYVTGIVGQVEVGIAGLKVPRQQVSLATVAAWQGDGVASGIVGLAYPGLTASYPGQDPRTDRYCVPGDGGRAVDGGRCNQVVYSSLVDGMFFREGVTRPLFAMALSRDESGRGVGGVVSFGGVPDLKSLGVKSGVFASTPIKMLKGDDRFRYYLIAVEGVVVLEAWREVPDEGHGWRGLFADKAGRISVVEDDGSGELKSVGDDVDVGGDATNSMGLNFTKSKAPPPSTADGIIVGSQYQDYIVDSGTTLSFLPSNVVSKFMSMFQPSAQFDQYSGFYLVDCKSKVPPIGIKIGGTVFWHNSKDLVKPYDWSGTTCIAGIQDSMRLGGVNILGDVFLDSVLAVFDLGAQQMRFAARREYAS